MRVLIIEDNRQLAANLVDYLEARGIAADFAADGVAGRRLAMAQRFDAIVLDLGLPGMNGMSLCRELRDSGAEVPIIILTARGELDAKLRGLAEGADDYLVKPVPLVELEARIRAQVRRFRGGFARRLSVADLVMDEATMEVRRAGRLLSLTRTDYNLLRVLMRQSPAVVSRRQLEDEVWGERLPESDTLRAHIHRLRRAVDQPSECPLVHTVHGVGYRLAADDT